MANRVRQFGQWLSKKRFFQETWFAKDPQITPDTEEALTQLSDDMVERLMAVIEELPVHPHEQESVLTAVKDAISHWQERPHAAANSIVVLGDPVSPIPRILTNSLDQLDIEHSQQPLSISLLDWIERPPNVETIEQRLKETLGFTELTDATDRTKSESTAPKALIIIPNLCWCFLRSADGLNGLDYLQDLLLSDRAQFWVLGSSIVGWEYLKHTLKFHAYCGGTTSLPQLSGEALQSWLSPIIEEFDVCFPDAALHKRLQNPDSLADIDLTIEKPIETLSEISQEISATVQSSARAMKDMVVQTDEDELENSPRLDYFNRLADISDGVGIVALQLFIKSLRYQQIDEKNTSEDGTIPPANDNNSLGSSEDAPTQSASDAENRRLVTTIPKKPALPSLSQSDMYLLYSLLLHDDMTIDALAKSLGDSPQLVNNQVQVLRNAGIIEQRENVIKINPEHYPELRRELARNNFIIEVP